MADEAKGGAAAGRSWKQAYADSVVTPEEQRALDEAARAQGAQEAEDSGTTPVPKREAEVAEEPDAVPPWAQIPDPASGFRFPKGKRVFFARLKEEWLDPTGKGDRVVVCWTLTDAEENMAVKRAMGDSNRTYKEMAKQMIRAVDGHKVDWSGKVPEGNVARFWEEIGPVGRLMLVNVYHRTHSPQQGVVLDFFINCFVSMSAVAG